MGWGERLGTKGQRSRSGPPAHDQPGRRRGPQRASSRQQRWPRPPRHAQPTTIRQHRCGPSANRGLHPKRSGRVCGAASSEPPNLSSRTGGIDPMSSRGDGLLDRIQSRRARVGIIGLGYVGLPLAVEFARSGFVTTGIDLDSRKIDAIRQGTSYIPDVPTAEVARLVAARQLQATTDFSVVAALDTINICVPTPLRKTKDPDMSYI